MPRFEKEYVHFMWDDELKGKRCFVSDSVNSLVLFVEGNKTEYIKTIDHQRKSGNLPFATDDEGAYKFCYYDPHYDLKVAREQGKVIQKYWKSEQEWEEYIGDDFPDDISWYRIKPEEKPITNRELAQWLAEGYGQYMDVQYNIARALYCYAAADDDMPVHKDTRVRLWGDTEWHVPTHKYMYSEDQE